MRERQLEKGGDGGREGEEPQENGIPESERRELLEGENAQCHMLKDERSNKVRAEKRCCCVLLLTS